MSEVKECVHYFKSNAGFKRFFLLLRKKWQQYGRVGGILVLEAGTPEERQALSGLLGRYLPAGDVKIRMQEFAEALGTTKFREVSLKELLDAYFQEELQTHKELRSSREQQRQQFFARRLAGLRGLVADWLQWALASKQCGGVLLLSLYKKDAAGLEIILNHLFQAEQLLAQAGSSRAKRLRLAILSAQVSGNPHYFDYAQEAGKLLVDFLAYRRWCGQPLVTEQADAREEAASLDKALPSAGGRGDAQKEPVGLEAALPPADLQTEPAATVSRTMPLLPLTAEERLELYYQSGLQPDDLSSNVVLAGVALYLDVQKQQAHPAYAAFNQRSEPYMVNMLNLAAIAAADCPHRRVFVVENQTVFTDLCAKLPPQTAALICTSGQVRTAALLVLDLLAASGCQIYYSGDFDPEGMLIADKIKQRHPEQVEFWHMGTEDYLRSLSGKKLPEQRLKQLAHLQAASWQPVVALLKAKQEAGYQELLLPVLAADVQEA